jgi:hypothetical protein
MLTNILLGTSKNTSVIPAKAGIFCYQFGKDIKNTEDRQ